MVADLMSACSNFPNESGMILRDFSLDKECGGRLAGIENVQDARRVLWVWSIVKCKRHVMFRVLLSDQYQAGQHGGKTVFD